MKNRKPERPKVLVVDDDDKILYAFRQVLRREGYRSIVATNGAEALEKVITERPDIVFMDITMPQLDGLQALQRMREQDKSVPIVLITGFGTMQTAIRAMQLGAFEYLTKPVDVQKIRHTARKALESTRARKADAGSVEAEGTAGPYEIVGRSPGMQEVYKLIGSISTTPNHTSVLLLGESGTGKELVARAIHAHGSNAAEPFIGINCTVLPENLLESELYGHERGAFTGASERKIGKFELAHNGTIFLDEIGNLSLHLQQKLLRVLQEREFERVGGNSQIHVGARFIVATNRDLLKEVKSGNFREDLFFRINVVSVQLPPLRERRDDIPPLASHFLMKYNRQLRKSVTGFADEAMKLIQTYAFPGNVRELENLIERAVMLTKGDVILPDVLRESTIVDPIFANLPIPSTVFSESRERLLKLFEQQFISSSLAKHRGNVTAAARESKMTRQNFQRLMKKHRIEAGRFRQ